MKIEIGFYNRDYRGKFGVQAFEVHESEVPECLGDRGAEKLCDLAQKLSAKGLNFREFRFPGDGEVLMAYHTTPQDPDPTSGNPGSGSGIRIMKFGRPSKPYGSGTDWILVPPKEHFEVTKIVELYDYINEKDYGWRGGVGHGFSDKY